MRWRFQLENPQRIHAATFRVSILSRTIFPGSALVLVASILYPYRRWLEPRLLGFTATFCDLVTSLLPSIHISSRQSSDCRYARGQWALIHLSLAGDLSLRLSK